MNDQSVASTTPAPSDKGLKAGALGLMSSVVIGVASTAPAYSLAATLGFVVLVVGVKAPAIMLLAFIPMFLIALAYQKLNAAEPDCGTSFTWVTRAFGPWAGWMAAWGILSADIIVMSNLAQIAGSYSFSLFGFDSLAESAFWATLAGVMWMIVMTYICYRGIEISARMQYGLLGIESIVLVAFAFIAFTKVYSGDPPAGGLEPSLSWLWPGGLGFREIIEGVVLAIFIYWGWDSAASVNEETSDPSRIPGLAGIISTVLLLAIYVLVTVATVAFAGVGEGKYGLGNEENSGDVFNALSEAVFGSTGWGQAFVALLIISVLTSAAASTQTTILPTSRTTLSMANVGAFPKQFARVHKRFQTPTWSTIGMGIASVAFYIMLTLISDNVLSDSIDAVGLMVAFYYGMTGLACPWYFRHELRNSQHNLWYKGILPGLGGVMLMGAFFAAAYFYADPEWGSTTVFGLGGPFVIGVGGLVFGAVLMVVYSFSAKDFFAGRTMPTVAHLRAQGLEPAVTTPEAD